MKNQKGDIVIVALGTVLFVALLGISVMSVINYLNRQKKVTRVKGVTHEIESEVVSYLLDPASYDVDNNLDLLRFNSRLATFSRNILGVQCAAGVSVCGVSLSDPSWDAAGREFRANIHYNGVDVKVADYNMSVKTPDATVLPVGDTCVDTDPKQPQLYRGPSLCKPAYGECLPGEYIVNLDSRTRGIKCRAFSFSCSNSAQPIMGKKVASLVGGNSNVVGVFTPVECVPQFDAYTVWGGP